MENNRWESGEGSYLRTVFFCCVWAINACEFVLLQAWQVAFGDLKYSLPNPFKEILECSVSRLSVRPIKD